MSSPALGQLIAIPSLCQCEVSLVSSRDTWTEGNNGQFFSVVISSCFSPEMQTKREKDEDLIGFVSHVSIYIPSFAWKSDLFAAIYLPF